jgi:uncharacterized membrane protein
MIFSFKNSHIFRREIEKWVIEGIITEEQAQNLYERYELNQPPPWYKNTNYVISGASFVLIAMSLFLLISANWDHLPIYARMMTGLVPFAAACLSVVYFTVKDQEQASELSAFAASLLLGANISLQAQIFHISAYYPDGVLWWIIGTLPIILYFKSNLIAAVFQGLFMIWLGMQSEYSQFSIWTIAIWASFAYVVFLKRNTLNAVLFEVSTFVLLINVIRFVWAKYEWKIADEAGLFFAAISLAFFFSELYSRLENSFSKSFLAYHGQAVRLAFTFTFFAFTAKTFTDAFHKQEYEIVILPFFILVSGVLLMARNKNRIITDWLGVTLMVVLFVEFLIGLDKNAAFYLNNVLMLGFFVWQIHDGISEKNKSNFMWGVFGVMLLALGRYISLIDDYVTSSIIFMFAGIGLFFINRFWNKKFGGNS